MFHSSHSYPPITESSFTKEPRSNALSQVRRPLLVYLVEAFETNEFSSHSTICRLHVKQFRKWIIFLNTVAVMKIADVMIAKARISFKGFEGTRQACIKSLKPTIIARLSAFILQELYETGLLGITSIPRCCNVCKEGPTRARVLFHPLPCCTSFCGYNRQEPVSADYSQRCTSRCSCYVGNRNPIRSQGLHIYIYIFLSLGLVKEAN